MGLRCFLYKIYDEAKRLYGYRHGRFIADQTGFVIGLDDNFPSFDWDLNFDLVDIVPEHHVNGHWVTLHCELTICDRESLDAFVQELYAAWKEYQRLKQVADPPKGVNPPKVRISGNLTWDPSHWDPLHPFSGPTKDELEIHPVKSGAVIQWPK